MIAGLFIDAVPAATTITAIVHRHLRIDLTASAPDQLWQRFETEQRNDRWQLDFKRHFSLHSTRCHPIHVLDDHLRFGLGLVACVTEQLTSAQPVLIDLFRRLGDPAQPRWMFSPVA